MTGERTVTKIQRTATPFSPLPQQVEKRRTAGYGRVSTNEEEQQSSYEAQVDYYTKMIQANPEWEFMGVYTDEGISATSTKKRDGFNQMVEDALAGKIQLIITKSVSRFARNTVDSLSTIRKLKEAGVEVWFEKEAIKTFDRKGELLITIMSSLAQEESRSISENVQWGKRRAFEQGKVSLPYKRFLGYEKGENGRPVIVPEEAEIVRLIYRLFHYGKSASFIASLLTDEGIPTPGGKTQWRSNVVLSILQNEKYAGNALLQKGYTTDFLTKARKINQGEIPQFFVENSHEAIIEPDFFEEVQHELQRRTASDQVVISTHPLSGKIFCADCGGLYGPRVWHSTSPYRRVIWQCNHKYRNAIREQGVNDSSRGVHAKGAKCPGPVVREEQVKAAFLAAFNQRIDERDVIFAAHNEALAALADTTALDAEAAALTGEREVVGELIRKAVEENARVPLDQAVYNARYDALLARFKAAETRLAEIDAERDQRRMKQANITRFLKILKKQNALVTEFEEEMWYITVDKVLVHADRRLAVVFRDGVVVEVSVRSALV